MKIRIKRKKVMKEAAVSPEEYINDDGPQIQLVVGDWGIEIDAGDVGSLQAYPLPLPCEPNGMMVYSIAWAGAQGGYGPLLYDLALEAAWKFQKAAVASDRHTVSDDAKGVWDYYLDNRDDVEVIQLDIDERTIDRYKNSGLKHLTKQTDDDCSQVSSIRHATKVKGFKYASNWSQQSTAYAYIKKDPTTITGLGDRLTINEE